MGCLLQMNGSYTMQSFYLRDSMLDPVELSLYRALTLVLCQRALLFTKVSLSTLFAVTTVNSTESEWEQLADQRLDFVLCDRDSVRPIAGILFAAELSYGQYDPTEQVAQFCSKAGFPLVRIQRQPSYLMQQLMLIIEPLLTSGTSYEINKNPQLHESIITVPAHGLNRSCKPKRIRKQPAYPGYGALRTIANKLA